MAAWDGRNEYERGENSPFGGWYLNAELEQRIEMVKEVEASKSKFWKMAKELTVFGYFTSEIGCTQALRYEPVPGRYDGNFPYKKGDKAWAT